MCCYNKYPLFPLIWSVILFLCFFKKDMNDSESQNLIPEDSEKQAVSEKIEIATSNHQAQSEEDKTLSFARLKFKEKIIYIQTVTKPFEFKR